MFHPLKRTILAAVAASAFAFFAWSSQAAPQVLDTSQQHTPTLEVRYQLKKNDLHLYLKVTHFTFSLEHMGHDKKYGEGHAHLYIDSKKAAKIFGTHYIYSGIPEGRHEVVVELAHNDHSSYGVKQSFTIDVRDE